VRLARRRRGRPHRKYAKAYQQRVAAAPKEQPQRCGTPDCGCFETSDDGETTLMRLEFEFDIVADRAVAQKIIILCCDRLPRTGRLLLKCAYLVWR
jgi:hypothetical protein